MRAMIKTMSRGAFIVTYTILEVPYHDYSTVGPPNPIVIIKAPILIAPVSVAEYSTFSRKSETSKLEYTILYYILRYSSKTRAQLTSSWRLESQVLFWIRLLFFKRNKKP